MLAVKEALKTLLNRPNQLKIQTDSSSVSKEFFKKQLAIEVLHAASIIVSALKNKSEKLKICSIGNPKWLPLITEVLVESNYDLSSLTFFDMESPFFKVAPFSEFKESDFDLIISSSFKNFQNTPVIDLDLFVESFANTLGELQSLNSCLNPRKLVFIALGLYLSPKDGAIVEAGAYQCGSTIFYSKFQRRMGLTHPIFALDTFEGMPSATDKDKGQGFVYDSGMFIDNPVELVQQRINSENESRNITLKKGLIQDSIKEVCDKNKISFAFLDSDQYAGTFSSLKALEESLIPGGIVIIDDTTVTGVVRAIHESCEKFPWNWKAQITHNFDLVTKSAAVKTP